MMSQATAFRLAAVAALVCASVTQGASAAPHRLAPVTARFVEWQPGMDRGRGNAPRAGMMRQGFGGGGDTNVRLLGEFDADKDGRLDAGERRAARQRAEAMGLNRGRGGRDVMAWGPIEPGPRVSLASARPYPTTPFYDLGTIRTLFFTFENEEWEEELMAFKRTDIDVPALLEVDGRKYPDVGVQFHGNSSFSGVPRGLKHSMRIAIDAVHDKQDVESYNTLLLLNAHEDPSFLKTVLAMQIARDYIAAPKATFVRVVINGESWGIYISQQQFNKDLTRESFKSTDGARWKVSGSPGGRGGGLSYLGDNPAAYKGIYEIKSKDDPAAWSALVNLTRVLNETPPQLLEAALAPILDVDAALKFLAVDNALVNSDGYWTRASDYSLYMEPNGRFHVIPYDVNSTFITGGGRGFGGGRGGSVMLDPLQASYDASKPLASKLLAVPELRARYLAYVRDIATKWLDWKTLGPIVERYQALIDADVRSDTRKLESYDDFLASAAVFQDFANRRRAFLLDATSGF